MKCKGRRTAVNAPNSCEPSELDGDLATNEKEEVATVDSDGVSAGPQGTSVERTEKILNIYQSSHGSVVDDEAAHGAGAIRPPVRMEVMGIYKREGVPREEELPDDCTISNYAPDQIMVRKRLRTRPFGPDDDVQKKNRLVTRSKKDNARKTKSKRSKSGRTKRSLRRRLKTKASDGTEYDVAAFKPEEGLIMRKSDWPFYHADLSEHSDDSTDDERVYDERAILWQSIDNYEALMSNPRMSEYFLSEATGKSKASSNNISVDVDASGDVTADPATEAIELILDNPRFGEQVIVKGISAKDIAIGDIFEVEGGHSPLKVEVSSPRLPCSYVDKRNGSPFGMKGVKRYTMTEGLAGWFTRVLVPGELRDGMHLVRTAHPHPKWTLPEISKALYGEGPRRRQMLGYPYWNRSKEELQEVCNLKELGEVDWKDEAKWILDGNDSDYEKDRQGKEEERARDFNRKGYLGALVTAGLAACCCGGMAFALFRD